MHEVWLPIPRFEKYKASSFGRIRNGLTKLILKQRQHESRGEKIYLKVNLGQAVKGRNTTVRVHMAVLLAFAGLCPETETGQKFHGCHFDDDGKNCRADNLC